MERRPSRMFEVLRECGALARLLPEVDRLWSVPQDDDLPGANTGLRLMRVLDISARLEAPLPVRFACLAHDLGKGMTPVDVLPRHTGDEERSAHLLKALCERLRVPTECRELADVMVREHRNIQRSGEMDAGSLVRLLERSDAFRKPARLDLLLMACECEARARPGHEHKPYAQRPALLAALAAAQSVSTQVIAAQARERGIEGAQIGEMIHHARVQAVAAFLARQASAAR